ncbi:transketolase [Candidatus Legionella polyplacis]|uniref:Transketolase n=1 Tax=Candidatus Legionella polyplacis TaxID=2005262 RepID=A0ABZ2GXX1_9GAMM
MKHFKNLANAIRFLSIDSIEKAKSGHPGTPLGMADIATVLWKKFLKHNPKNPLWFNRDRFILSNGHCSALLYSLLHITGYNLSIKDLKNFRQLHSKTPGHPEYLKTPGIEATTGPLGQGIAMAIGIAIGEKNLSKTFNKQNLNLIDHYTYVFAGDGCLMEGISHESCSLAGTLGLNKLILFYDNNNISIDGKVKNWFKDDTKKRFQSYNWKVIGPINGHNTKEIITAIQKARSETKKPSIIICKTIIGFGSPIAGNKKCHSNPLGKHYIKQTRKILNWTYPPFFIPKHIYKQWNHIKNGEKEEKSWINICNKYKKKYKNDYHEFLRRINKTLPKQWKCFKESLIKKYTSNNKHKYQSTRNISQKCIQNFTKILPEIFGGSSDLTESNKTGFQNKNAINNNNFPGNYIHYGVREFAMASIMNGLSLYGGHIPYGGTFLVFSDYAKSAIRMSALMKQHVIYIFTHDSIGIGEDGPTHQPIEQISMLRNIPNIEIWRPSNSIETIIAWIEIIEHNSGPSCLILSKQKLPELKHTNININNIKKGGYIIDDTYKKLNIILISTGSELQLAISAKKCLQKLGYNIRVISMPCCERFLSQKSTYKEYVLPKFIKKRIAIEASSTFYWHKFVGLDGLIIGINEFGISAPEKQIFTYFKITIKNIINKAKEILEN